MVAASKHKDVQPVLSVGGSLDGLSMAADIVERSFGVAKKASGSICRVCIGIGIGFGAWRKG